MDNIRFVKLSLVQDCQIVLHSFVNCLRSLTNSDVNQLRVYAEKFVKFGNFLVAENDEKRYVGFAAYYANDSSTHAAFLSMIAVDPLFRKIHIGTALLDYIVSDCRNKGMTCLRLEVAKENLIAQSFYQRNGFVKKEMSSESGCFFEKKL